MEQKKSCIRLGIYVSCSLYRTFSTDNSLFVESCMSGKAKFWIYVIQLRSLSVWFNFNQSGATCRATLFCWDIFTRISTLRAAVFFATKSRDLLRAAKKMLRAAWMWIYEQYSFYNLRCNNVARQITAEMAAQNFIHSTL